MTLLFYLLVFVQLMKSSSATAPTNSRFQLKAQYFQYDWAISCGAFQKLRRLRFLNTQKGFLYQTNKSVCEQKDAPENVASDFMLEIKDISEQRNEYFCKTGFRIASNKKLDTKFIRVIFLLNEKMGSVNGSDLNSWETVEIGVSCFLKHAKAIPMQGNSNDDMLPSSISIFVMMPHVPPNIITSPSCKISNSYIWAATNVPQNEELLSVPKLAAILGALIMVGIIMIVIFFKFFKKSDNSSKKEARDERDERDERVERVEIVEIDERDEGDEIDENILVTEV